MSVYQKIIIITFLALLAIPKTGYSQQRLSLQEAVRIGLENNYAIRLTAQDARIATNNVTLGNAGFLPTLDLRGTRTFARNNSRQEFETNPPREVNGATSNALSGSANLAWTIFDGMGMFINLNRLRLLQRTGELFTKETVENTVADITDAYYEVIRQGAKIRSLEEAINISKQRLEMSRAQYEIGVAAKAIILTAEVDYNADQSALLQQQELLQNAVITLNQVLGQAPETPYTIRDTIQMDPAFSATIARAIEVTERNPLLQRFRLQQDISYLALKSLRASRLPTVTAVSAYTYGRTISDPLNPFSANFNQNRGFNYGLQVGLNVFNGFNLRRQMENARIGIQISNLEYGQVQNQVLSDYARALSRYNNRLKLIDLEQTNLRLARQNADIALERYRLGLLTALELREAQRNLLIAQNRLIDILYEAKASETELKRLSGLLVMQPVSR